ncbi:hypothetical protein M8J77_007803 [Diaphorina citri]|nr:hypothetical protein M8J77_007803 [Diaphorina citri]
MSMANENNDNIPFVDTPSRNLGPALLVCHLNIEGISRSKCEYLYTKILLPNKVDVLALQETHTENEEKLTSRGSIQGNVLLGATYHKRYGVATYVRTDIENVSLLNTTTTTDDTSSHSKMCINLHHLLGQHTYYNHTCLSGVVVKALAW